MCHKQAAHPLLLKHGQGQALPSHHPHWRKPTVSGSNAQKQPKID